MANFLDVRERHDNMRDTGHPEKMYQGSQPSLIGEPRGVLGFGKVAERHVEADPVGGVSEIAEPFLAVDMAHIVDGEAAIGTTRSRGQSIAKSWQGRQQGGAI